MFLKADKSLALFLRIHYDRQMWGCRNDKHISLIASLAFESCPVIHSVLRAYPKKASVRMPYT